MFFHFVSFFLVLLWTVGCSTFWMTVTQSVCSLGYIHFLLTKGNLHFLPFIKMKRLYLKKARSLHCRGLFPKDDQFKSSSDIIKTCGLLFFWFKINYRVLGVPKASTNSLVLFTTGKESARPCHHLLEGVEQGSGQEGFLLVSVFIPIEMNNIRTHAGWYQVIIAPWTVE